MYQYILPAVFCAATVGAWIMSEKDYYPAGAYNDPNAPYNQTEPVEDTDAFADKKQEMTDERIKDLWQEAIGEAPLHIVIDVGILLTNNMHDDDLGDKMIGTRIRAQVINYCTPSDSDVIEALEAEHDI